LRRSRRSKELHGALAHREHRRSRYVESRAVIASMTDGAEIPVATIPPEGLRLGT
jgi:hypothetical protein